MGETNKSFRHAKCGGNVRRNSSNGHYVCDRCNAEAEIVISAAAKVEGRPEEVELCNPHEDAF